MVSCEPEVDMISLEGSHKIQLAEIIGHLK